MEASLFLKTNNITPAKSLTYEYPDGLSTELIPSFIRGYIDGDGTVGTYDNGKGCKSLIICFVGTKNFINSVASIIPVSGLIRQLKARNCWEIRWNGKKAIEVGQWVYSDQSLYKSEKTKRFLQNLSFGKVFRNDCCAEQRECALKLLAKGTSATKTAKIVGVAWQTIYKWRKKYGPRSCQVLKK